MRCMIFRVNLRKHLRQEAVAAHHEEDAGLAEHHHQDDRGQSETSSKPDQIADLWPADFTQRPCQCFFRADNLFATLRSESTTGFRQFLAARCKRNAGRIHNGLCADAADHACRDEQVKDRADCQRSDQSDRHVALGIFCFLRCRRNGIETDIGKEDRGRRRRYAAETKRGEWREILHLHDWYGENNEQSQRRNFDRDENRIDCRAFARSDDQKPSDKAGNAHCGQVDDAAIIRPEHQRIGNIHAEGIFEQANDIARPANRHSARSDSIFKDQCPADHPCDQLAHDGIAIGVGRSRHRHHCRHFGVAKRGDGTDDARNDESQHHARPGFLRRFCGQNENTGADNGTNAEHRQLKRTERARERLFLRCAQNGVERFDATENHKRPLRLIITREPSRLSHACNPLRYGSPFRQYFDERFHFLMHAIEPVVQPHNFEFGAQVHFIIMAGRQPVHRRCAVLAHHDHGSLQRGRHREHQVEENIGIGIELHPPLREDAGVQQHPRQQDCDERKDECPGSADGSDAVGKPIPVRRVRVGQVGGVAAGNLLPLYVLEDMTFFIFERCHILCKIVEREAVVVGGFGHGGSPNRGHGTL